MPTQFHTRLHEIQSIIHRHAHIHGCQEARLIVVTKGSPVAINKIAAAHGIHCFGESNFEELNEKAHELPSSTEWHFIGHIQRRKAPKIATLADWVHSLDRIETAQSLGKRACEHGRVIKALIQVNTTDEPQKHGIRAEELNHFVEHTSAIPGLEFKGLMTMGPQGSDPDKTKKAFDCLYSLAQQHQNEHGTMELSMGMSNDFKIALECGATMLRIGSALTKVL